VCRGSSGLKDSPGDFYFISLMSITTEYATFFLNSHSEGWSPNWVQSARRPLNGLVCLPQVIMMMQNLVE
jgi:hypothetical protein